MATEKLRILIVESNAREAASLRAMLDAQPDLTVVGVATTGHEAVHQGPDLHPQVVLIDINLPDMDGVQATWLIASKNPDSSVIVVTSEHRPEFMQRAMVAGAQGYLLKPVRDLQELAKIIRTVRQRAHERRASLVPPPAPTPTVLTIARTARRVALFSPKGGQGKTSISVNLAVMLRTLTGQPTVLVDADLRFGDANILLDLPFQRSIVDLLPHIDQLDSDLLDQVLAKHSSGLQLLIRPERPELAETISAEHMEQVLKALTHLFDYIVIDCEVSYDEKLLAVLDAADSILLVLTPNLGALRNARHFLQLAETLGYPRDKIDFVLNRANSNVGLTPADVERALGPGRCFRLDSFGRLLTNNLNSGTPTVLAQPRSEFTRLIRDIAEHIRRGRNGTG